MNLSSQVYDYYKDLPAEFLANKITFGEILDNLEIQDHESILDYLNSAKINQSFLKI